MALILEQCHIQPSSSNVNELTLPLVSFDIICLDYNPVYGLLFFEFPCSKDHFLETIVPKLKQSLRETLKHFLPFSGSIIRPINSGWPISRYVLGDSVSLTIAQCDKDFNHLTGYHPRAAGEFYSCIPELPPATHSSDFIIFPVTALQVTLFPGHGICIGFTNHHTIGDANTVIRFVKAWATVTKFGGDSQLFEDQLLPFYDRTSIADPEGLDSIYWELMKKCRPVDSPPLKFNIDSNKVRATFVMTKDDVEKLKNYVLGKLPKTSHVSSFTVICAHLWVCLAKSLAAIGEDVADDEVEYFCFPADCRARLNPPLPANYFGNCLALLKAEIAHGKLKTNDGFLIAAESIGDAIRNTVYNKKGILDGAENWPSDYWKLEGKRIIGVSGSPRFDLYDADFGWGKAKKLEDANIDGDTDTSMSFCKSRDFQGGFEIGLSKPKVMVEAFARMFTILPGNL
ncbi:malonyl-coenzyme:anthocyanin 5-O-glucoside-6'''-O-malonyltransferase-like [Olea europaea var. sylvestris]|uniref:malonyl-coenzyme:anthocyanin 5-O-glucoside-6'''-O-malonyltransferase-like n=1 Tax=Olea europaea var. sylvestris TaxID=158386 RepID=UPI000C1CEA6D|nr:malonyl-coenzyme:anthocyanin 5-O-glucoside-6'''-O-malonyltransferase-like [Olea europaea var. sylvestris]